MITKAAMGRAYESRQEEDDRVNSGARVLQAVVLLFLVYVAVPSST
ncbi:hypothetical protein [Streptomyces purpureus]|uniref:Uncharacterized protein n=1 Tax=Streptomyces purpureus TaxID=1951 RepID=A0A918HF90_9ACTN|nr:hypothetical protein [Streptomyces purpureus]GGT53702.1 hypothetical protein GCM10014713_54480 [Streptomyces purpureus]